MARFFASFLAVWLAFGVFNISFIMTIRELQDQSLKEGTLPVALVSGPFGTGIMLAEALYKAQ